jgi:diguanylate cyclase (GGDEF)-like protein
LPGPGYYLPEMTADALSSEVVSLLALHESAEVPRWAAKQLGALLGASQANVLRVFPIRAARLKEAAPAGCTLAVAEDEDAESLRPVEANSDLFRAIEERRSVSERAQTGANRLLFPLSSADEVRYVVEIVGGTDLAASAVAASLVPVVVRYYERMVDAETDPLTRLANRRVFYSQISAGLPRWLKGELAFFLAVADIDHFKQVNDRFGHLYGDEILIHFARVMRKTFRAGDLLYRFGGEEFVVVFAVNDKVHGATALERFRKATAEYDFPRVGRVTASIGFTRIDGTRTPATTLVDRADQALYCAKSQGRNRVCQYEDLVAAGVLAEDKPSESEATLF